MEDKFQELHDAALRMRQGKKLVIANGCFDLLHPGHINLLKIAKTFGDMLLVLVNDDDSIRMLKGLNRPVVPLVKRLEQLNALVGIVDLAIPMFSLTPSRYFEEFKPEVIVKGDDYTLSQVVGRDIVEGYGGRVEIVPRLPGYSTTALCAETS